MIPFVLHSPATGNALEAEGDHTLRDTETGARWPVVDGIPYLRTNREALVEEVLVYLDAGDARTALLCLLADRDDWWTGPPADPDSLRDLVARRDKVTLREAVYKLGWGDVGDYFVNRWTDPTYLAGLSLLEAHWNEPATVFELTCGTGTYLREMQLRGVKVAGSDVVFAKLWLARNLVLEPKAQLVCFDATSPHWPIADSPVDLAVCNDAFYFLDDKPGVLECLRRTAGEEGWLAVSHIHNSERPGFAGGKAVSAGEIEELFPDGLVYDDQDLTQALVEARAPHPRDPGELKGCEAFSLVAGPGMRPAPRAVVNGLSLPKAGATLRLNPLYRPDGNGAFEIAWPSEFYATEYAARVTYPMHSEGPKSIPWEGVDDPLIERVRRREFVSLPERW